MSIFIISSFLHVGDIILSVCKKKIEQSLFNSEAETSRAEAKSLNNQASRKAWPSDKRKKPFVNSLIWMISLMKDFLAVLLPIFHEYFAS